MHNGDFSSAKAAAGDSTNFAKLKMNAALICYSDGCACCALEPPQVSSRLSRNIGATPKRMVSSNHNFRPG